MYNETFRDLWTGQYQAVIDYYSAPFPAAKDDGSPKLDSTGHLVMSKPLSFSSLSKMKALLTQMYDYAMQNDIIHKNYATFLTLPKQEKVPLQRVFGLASCREGPEPLPHRLDLPCLRIGHVPRWSHCDPRPCADIAALIHRAAAVLPLN